MTDEKTEDWAVKKATALIQGYIGPDHKVMDLQRFHGALSKGFDEAHEEGLVAGWDAALNAPQMFSAMSEGKEDRRQSPRKLVRKSGRIVFNNRHSVIDCVVHNISANGARLRVISVVGIPNYFDLYIGDDRRAAQVVWKSAESLGVTFEEGWT